MLGLALEGGGAKGAYQIGAYKALMELGFRFDVVAGTSIGAINAALIAQGDWERAGEFWSTVRNEDLFEEKDRVFLEVINRQIGLDTLSILRENLKAAMKNGGIDTSGIRKFLEKNIDPERLLQSPMDYGMVAVAVPDLQPLIAYKESMTPENLISHVIASATFPGFQPTVVNGKKYLDGGFYDACPYNMLLERGCDEVIAIRLYGFGFIHPPKEKEKVISILPSENLGPVMNFDPEISRRNMTIGYYDTMRTMKKLPGDKYYFTGYVDGFAAFAALPEENIREAAAALRISAAYAPRRALFEEILPAMASECKLAKSAGYDELLLALLEHRATRLKIERLQFYTPAELQSRVQESLPEQRTRRTLLLRHPEDAVDELLAGLPVFPIPQE